MKLQLSIFSALLFGISSLLATPSLSKSLHKKRTIIQMDIKSFETLGSQFIEAYTIEYIYRPDTSKVFPKLSNGVATWEFDIDKPLMIQLPTRSMRKLDRYLLEPGDSIIITPDEKLPHFTGPGSKKFNVQAEIETEISSLIAPSARSFFYATAGEKDFWLWNGFVDQRKSVINKKLEQYKTLLSETAYRILNLAYLYESEDIRRNRFLSLFKTKEKYGLTYAYLKNIYQKTIKNQDYNWILQQNGRIGNLVYFYNVVKTEVLMEDYPREHPIWKDIDMQNERLYAVADSFYRGEVRANVITYIILKNAIRHSLFKSGNDLTIKFFSTLQFPEYKEYIKAFEDKRLERNIQSGKKGVIQEFIALNEEGDTINVKDIDGKIVVIKASLQNQNLPNDNFSLSKIAAAFKNDTSVVIAEVLCGLPSLANEAKGNRSIKGVQQWRSTGSDEPLSFQRIFDVTDSQTLYILDPHQRFMISPVKSAESFKWQEVVNMIKEVRPYFNDGPYVMHHPGHTEILTINDHKLSKQILSKGSKNYKLKVSSSEYKKYFNVKLKGNYTVEPDAYSEPVKILALSDIEGNLNAFRNLLLANKVIDQDFNWTFGNGHLVFNGDLFDRGQQVTECLWLIYSLEEKAKVAGGYVHYILGNHEIMNLQGQFNYVHKKYKYFNSEAMKLAYDSLYTNSTELGRWLRSKNIIEKIGNKLFFHAGICQAVNQSSIDIQKMNGLVRQNLTNPVTIAKSDQEYVKMLFDSNTSPFWYRGYYNVKDKKAVSINVIDSTLRKFNVSTLITGHTILGDTINVHFEKKVINVDTHHAKSKSEALLIEGNNFYRVNAEGKRVLLFREDEK